MAGISETVIGLTVVAVGTSLPELAASLAAAMRGKSALAIGNVVGSKVLATKRRDFRHVRLGGPRLFARHFRLGHRALFDQVERLARLTVEQEDPAGL